MELERGGGSDNYIKTSYEFNVLSSGVYTCITSFVGPSLTVSACTVQLYTVYGLRPEMVTVRWVEGMLRVTVPIIDVTMTTYERIIPFCWSRIGGLQDMRIERVLVALANTSVGGAEGAACTSNKHKNTKHNKKLRYFYSKVTSSYHLPMS